MSTPQPEATRPAPTPVPLARTYVAASAGGAALGAAPALLAVAASHQAIQAALRVSTVRAVLAVWNTLDFRDLSRWWFSGPSDRSMALVSMAQESVAAQAADYVQAALALQGIEIEAPSLVPDAFAGIASDGRDLDSLLLGAVVKAKEKIGRGGSQDEARAAGAEFLTRAINTQVSDAGRAADQVALVAAPTIPSQRRAPARERRAISGTIENTDGQRVNYGWVRMLQPPSCGRCAVLAGRFYKWSDGFLRHDNCDCRHIPVAENVAGDLTTDPKAYFDSLSREDQDKYFGVYNSRAIRAGGDISQIVNATTRRGAVYTADNGRRYTREGTTRRGFYGSREKGKARVRRPTPQQIYRDARGDQAAAIRLLKEFGYIL